MRPDKKRKNLTALKFVRWGYPANSPKTPPTPRFVRVWGGRGLGLNLSAVRGEEKEEKRKEKKK